MKTTLLFASTIWVFSTASMASSWIISQGTGSSCKDACQDARLSAQNQIQILCQSGTATEINSASQCLDGGDYDIKCSLTLELQCSSMN